MDNLTRICNTCGIGKLMKSFPISNKELGTRRYKCTKCTENKPANKVPSPTVNYEPMEEQISIVDDTPDKFIDFATKQISKEINISIKKDKIKKIPCSYNLSPDTVKKIEQLKYLYMPPRTQLSTVIEIAIDKLYEELSE